MKCTEGRRKDTTPPPPRPIYMFSWCSSGEERLITASAFFLWKENMSALMCPFNFRTTSWVWRNRVWTICYWIDNWPFSENVFNLYENMDFFLYFKRLLVHICFLLGLLFNLKMEATYSSETSVDSQWNTWYYIPEETVPHSRLCGSFKSNIVINIVNVFASGVRNS
jgi:hypothetical protein